MNAYEEWKGRLGWRVTLAHYALVLDKRQRMNPDLVAWARTVMAEYRTRWTP